MPAEWAKKGNTHTEHLHKRREPDEMIVHHLAFAEWMRQHAANPQHMHEVLNMNSWDQLRWDRWTSLPSDDPSWRMTTIDTTELEPEKVAGEATRWYRAALNGDAPVFRAG